MSTVSTGIDGIDDLIKGYPRGRTILISGCPGSGKTIMALQFTHSCLEKGEGVVYVATEERTEDLKDQAQTFGWSLEEYEESGKLKVIPQWRERVTETKYDYSNRKRLSRLPLVLKELHPDESNIIIDNIGVYAMGMELHEFREALDLIAYELEKRKATTLLICDDAVGENFHTVAMHSAFGAIRLLKRDNPFTDVRERAMEIVKMRHTKVPIDFLTFQITNGGIRIVKRNEGE